MNRKVKLRILLAALSLVAVLFAIIGMAMYIKLDNPDPNPGIITDNPGDKDSGYIKYEEKDSIRKFAKEYHRRILMSYEDYQDFISKADYESKLTVGMMALVLLGFAIIGFLAYALRLWSIPVIILLAASIIGGLLLNRRAYEHREASVRTNMKGSQKQTHEVLLRISKIEQQYSETYHAMVKLEPITKKAKAVTYTPKQN